MTDATLQKLQAFASGANWVTPHPLDIRRFSKFVIEAYERGDTTLSSDEFDQAIRPFRALSGQQLDEWMDRYEQGIYLLKVYNNP